MSEKIPDDLKISSDEENVDKENYIEQEINHRGIVFFKGPFWECLFWGYNLFKEQINSIMLEA